MPGREKQCAYELHAIHIAAAKGSVEAVMQTFTGAGGDQNVRSTIGRYSTNVDTS